MDFIAIQGALSQQLISYLRTQARQGDLNAQNLLESIENESLDCVSMVIDRDEGAIQNIRSDFPATVVILDADFDSDDLQPDDIVIDVNQQPFLVASAFDILDEADEGYDPEAVYAIFDVLDEAIALLPETDSVASHLH